MKKGILILEWEPGGGQLFSHVGGIQPGIYSRRTVAMYQDVSIYLQMYNINNVKVTINYVCITLYQQGERDNFSTITMRRCWKCVLFPKETVSWVGYFFYLSNKICHFLCTDGFKNSHLRTAAIAKYLRLWDITYTNSENPYWNTPPISLFNTVSSSHKSQEKSSQIVYVILCHAPIHKTLYICRLLW